MGPAQTFSPFTPGVCCFAVAADHGPHYGAALAVGDFDGDGLEDLAIGAPFTDVTLISGETVTVAGAVHILRGEKGTGLVLTGQSYLHEEVLTNRTKPRSFELFGLALPAGQFDGRRGDDLAIGAPYERLNDDFGGDSGYNGYGAVYVAYFGGAGLASSASDVFMDVAPGPVPDAPSDGDRFGWALAAGNFDRRHDDDLAIGIPRNHTTIRTQDDSVIGAVYVLYSHGAGLGEAGASFFFPGDFAGGVQTPPPPEGVLFEFGAALAAGDYQGDGVADLFIGVPGLSLGPDNVGGVEIRPGVARVGLGSGPSYLLLHQDTSQPGQTWEAEEHDLPFTTEDQRRCLRLQGRAYGPRAAPVAFQSGRPATPAGLSARVVGRPASAAEEDDLQDRSAAGVPVVRGHGTADRISTDHRLRSSLPRKPAPGKNDLRPECAPGFGMDVDPTEGPPAASRPRPASCRWPG